MTVEANISERKIRARSGSRLILETSEVHYVENTVASEFPNGNLETLKALSLVVRENLHHNHHPSRPLCDTTHCQVFGQVPDLPKSVRAKIETAALQTFELELNLESTDKSNSWFPFYLGGTQHWTLPVKTKVLQGQLGIKKRITSLSRLEDKLQFKFSDQTQQGVLCEKVRNQLGLLSCPDKIRHTQNSWIFSGKGEGHGLGMNLIEANLLAAQGKEFREILKKYYPDVQLSIR